MEGYVRFSSSSSPPSNPPPPPRRFSFSPRQSVDSTSTDLDDSPHHLLQQQQQQQQTALHTGTNNSNGAARGCMAWGSSWLSAPPLPQFLQRWRTPSPRAYQSNYMTLVPLSDERLKPRRTKLIVGSVLLLALLAIAGVFVLVPRGVSVGTIDVHYTRMTFNTTTKTYRIILQADVPVYNNNYLQASLSGNLTVSFYDAEAGWGALGPVMLAARTNPQMLSVNVDASNLPRRYTKVVYDQCFNFPRILVFFLLGTFHTSYLGYNTELPSVDTYFLLDCSGVQDLSAEYSSSSGAATSSSNSLPAMALQELPAAVQAQLQQRQAGGQQQSKSAWFRWHRQQHQQHQEVGGSGQQQMPRVVH